MLLATPAGLFDTVIPFLLLLATLTFAFGDRAGIALRRIVRVGPGIFPVLQFVIAIYGGYFGGAVGLMMMATWSLLTANGNLKAMAPARALLVSATNGAAVVWFICAGARSVGRRRWRCWARGVVGGRLSRRTPGTTAACDRGASLRGTADRDGDRGLLPAPDVTGREPPVKPLARVCALCPAATQ